MKAAKRPRPRPRGQAVRLPVGDHLQPVLDPAQEAGRPPPARRRRGAADARRGPAAASAPSVVGLAQRRIAAAPDQLQRLRQELDLADAALAELDVVPGDARHRVGCRHARAARAPGPGPMLVDPPLHGVDVGDRGEIEAAPPDERPDRLEERRAQRQVAGHRARLDHRRAFPVLAHAFVVGDGGRQGDDRRRRRRGPGAAADRCGRRSRRRRGPP